MNSTSLLLGNGVFAVLLLSMFSTSFADEQISTTQLIPIGENIAIEKTTLTLSVSETNHLPWGFVEGKINNPVLEYPVIIQIYDKDDNIDGNNIGAIHFAQTDVNEDGSYEHKFRVRDVDDDKVTNIFEGDYTVVIFKVVYLFPDLSST